MNKTAQVLRDRRVMASAIFSCVSMFLIGNANLYAQGNGAATMRTIPTFIGYEETFQWSDVPEIVSQASSDSKNKDASEYSWASDLLFQKEIWQLQFSYKNMRTIDVDFPTKDGKLQTKRVWYLVYSVTNTGKRLASELDKEHNADVSEKVLDDQNNEQIVNLPSNNLDGVYKPVEIDYNGKKDGAVKFIPRFVYASASAKGTIDFKATKDGQRVGQSPAPEEGVYYDAFLPLAMVQIRKKEQREGQELLDSVRIATVDIQPGQTVWGVATWTDVDPRIDKFSVYISGLTNALRWEMDEDNASDSTQIGEGRNILRKVLKLNFFAPGDEIHRGGKEIYNNLPGELDYQWIYL